jgi:hypothetical protein
MQATVTISDDYTFWPSGPLGSRLWIQEYQAANLLETRFHYLPFSDRVTFEKLYTGLRSDQIMGFAFNTQRPAH